MQLADSTFSWLHLSDLHYGLSSLLCLWPNLRVPFFDDLEQLHKISGPWNAVFFTGDLVQRGRAEEFSSLDRDFLIPLSSHLKELGSAPVFLCVPGNHDLRRPDLDDNPAADTLIRPGGFDEYAQQFWTKPKGAYRKVVKQAFEAYSAWWKGRTRELRGLTDGLLPGDFSYSLDLGEIRIGVVGLNTAFLQLAEGDYKGRLVWHPEQLRSVCPSGGDDWSRQHHIAILLTHHGPDWLTVASQRAGQSEIAPAGRFALHIFGHQHETQLFTTRRAGSGRAVRLLQGTSLFGYERFGKDRRTSRSHGYSAGRLHFHHDTVTLRLWPRTATDRIGYWRFVPDYLNAALGDDQATEESLQTNTNNLTNTPGVHAASDNSASSQSEAGFPTYRTWQLAKLAEISSLGFPSLDTRKQYPTPWDNYIPLSTTVATPTQEYWTRRVPLESTLTEKRVFVIGEPGSGKSTFARRLAYELCANGLRHTRPFTNKVLEPHDQRLPILFQLSDYRDRVPPFASLSDLTKPGTWLRFLGELSAYYSWEISQDTLSDILAHGECLILFDGLDELHREDREQHFPDAVTSLSEEYPEVPIVVTSRPTLNEDVKERFPRFFFADIAELDGRAIVEFVSNLPTDTRAVVPFVTKQLNQYSRIRMLLTTPLTLAFYVILYVEQRALPRLHAEIYEAIANWLTSSRELECGLGPSERIRSFRALAHALQVSEHSADNWLSLVQAQEILAPVLADQPLDIREYLTEEATRGGVLALKNEGVEFRLPILKEYFAARELSCLPDRELQSTIAAGSPGFDESWQYCLGLLGGMLGQDSPKTAQLLD